MWYCPPGLDLEPFARWRVPNAAWSEQESGLGGCFFCEFCDHGGSYAGDFDDYEHDDYGHDDYDDYEAAPVATKSDSAGSKKRRRSTKH